MSILKNERTSLLRRIRALWEQGCNTAEMAKALQLPESLIERKLHRVLELRRSIINSLGRSE